MDLPGRTTREELVGCLAGLERVNRLLGGIDNAIRAIEPLLARSSSSPVRVCDVGTGSADIPRALVRRARRRGLAIHVTAVEFSPSLAAAARRACRTFPEIAVVEADARAILSAAAAGGTTPPRGESLLPSAPAKFDVVCASLFLHHFTPAEVTDWMGLFARASTAGWVVNDLERHAAAWLGIKVLGPFLCRNRVFLNDAPLSVRRAYTPAEWRGLVRDAGLHGRVERRFPFRIRIVGRPA